MPNARDFTKREFEAALNRNGFTRPAHSILEYVALAPPCETIHVCPLNAGSRRRDQLAYLIRKQHRFEAGRVLSVSDLHE